LLTHDATKKASLCEPIKRLGAFLEIKQDSEKRFGKPGSVYTPSVYAIG